MRNSEWFAVVAGVWLGSVAGVAGQEATPAQAPPPDPMAAQMERVKKFTEPGPQHKALERFLGKWATETRFFVFGQAAKPEKGTAECSWLMKGRWMKCSRSGQLFSKPAESFTLIGYDNFRKNYVMTTVTSLSTGMAHTAGDSNEEGSLLTLFGTIDEYGSDEPDRMWKYLWRFETADKIVSEEYDLALVDSFSKFAEVTYTRLK